MTRIALVSNSGVYIDEHFGRARFFRIYELTDDGYSFLESRDAVDACQHARRHDKTDFDRIVDLVSDCDALLVQRIGEGAASYLISKGVRVFEVSGSIDAVLGKFIADKLLWQDSAFAQEE